MKLSPCLQQAGRRAGEMNFRIGRVLAIAAAEEPVGQRSTAIVDGQVIRIDHRHLRVRSQELDLPQQMRPAASGCRRRSTSRTRRGQTGSHCSAPRATSDCACRKMRILRMPRVPGQHGIYAVSRSVVDDDQLEVAVGLRQARFRSNRPAAGHGCRPEERWTPGRPAPTTSPRPSRTATHRHQARPGDRLSVSPIGPRLALPARRPGCRSRLPGCGNEAKQESGERQIAERGNRLPPGPPPRR